MKAFKIFTRLFIILLLLFVGFCITVYVSFNIMGYELIQINENDMEPDFYSGDLLIVEPTTIENLKVNDIVVFKTGSNKVTHKVVGVSNEIIVTQGINCDTIDIIGVNQDNLYGKMIVKVEQGKLLLLIATNPTLMIAIIIIFGLIATIFITKDSDKKQVKKLNKNKR